MRIFILFLIVGLTWFAPLDQRKLVKPDEGRYAEIPREMVASGDWLTPRLNGIKYFEKPPLQYWATATAYTAFGEHNWTARLWPALTGFLGILFTAYTTSLLWGRTAGRYAAGVLASSLLYVLVGHINTLDMGVSFFLSSAILAFAVGQKDGTSPSGSRNWVWLAWALLALAVLSKGLIGLVLPGATLVLYTLVQRDISIWRKLRFFSGLSLFLLITAPWFIAVSLANEEFAHFFFIHEHFERFLTKQHGRYQPMWYFIPILFIGMVPWIVALFSGISQGFRRDNYVRFQPQRFLLIWAIVVFGFFSVSSSKLVSYILPLFPALAALIGWRLSQVHARGLRWHALPMFFLGIIAVLAAPEATRFASAEVPAELYANYIPWLAAAGVSLTLGSAFAFVFAAKQKAGAAIASLTLGGLLFSQLIITGHDALSPASSAYHIAQKIKPYVNSEAPFYSVNTYDQTLQPYLQRTTQMVGYMDELGFGIATEPSKFIPTEAEFAQRWEKGGQAFALMSPSTYEQHKTRGLPMHVIASDTRRVVVTRLPINILSAQTP